MLSSCAIHYGKCKCWPANVTPNTLINSLLVLLSVSKECKCIFTTTSNFMSPNQDALYQMLNMLYITLKCEWLMLFLKKNHICLVVWPLKSLMLDQLNRWKSLVISAEAILRQSNMDTKVVQGEEMFAPQTAVYLMFNYTSFSLFYTFSRIRNAVFLISKISWWVKTTLYIPLQEAILPNPRWNMMKTLREKIGLRAIT